MTMEPPPITQEKMTPNDIIDAVEMARRLGYPTTVYTSHSCLWGLTCLPENANKPPGHIIKTQEFGLIFLQDTEDLAMNDLREKWLKLPRRKSP